MNVYEFDIWNQVKVDGEFSHTSIRHELVHALNEERAKHKVTLEPKITWCHSNLHFETSGEFIYATRKTGTVRKKLFYVYSDGRAPRPVKG